MHIRSTKRTLMLCLLLAIATIALYARTAHNPFLKYDDDHYVTDNWHVRSGLHSNTIVWAFTSFDEANWHPLTWVSHALDVQLFGLNPARHHQTSVFIHAANAMLLFLLLQAMTGCTWRSFFVAALFAIHPVNVESVAWIAERKSVLCMFFFLLTLLAYHYYARRPSLGSYVSTLFVFALALMSKPMAVTLPFALLLLDYWPLNRISFSPAGSPGDTSSPTPTVVEADSISWLVLEKLPFLSLSAVSSILTLKAQKAAGAVAIHHSFGIRLENVIVSYALYLGKAVWPVRLAVLYPYPNSGWPPWAVALSALLLVLITVLVFKLHHRYLPFGWFWFLGTMVPMIGLVQVGNQGMADRYAYLPFIGLFVIVVWGAAESADYFHLPIKYVLAVGTAAVIALSAMTYHQLGYWRDDYTLWSHTLAITRNNFVAEDNLGEALIRQGKYYEGIAHFHSALEIEPADPVGQINLGIYAIQQGDLHQAAARLQYALQLSVDPHLQATAYANLGGIYFSLHDYNRARQNFESAIQFNASFPFVFRDLGLIAQKSGDWNRAASFYAMYASVEPNDVAYFLLAQALDHAGDSQRAKLAYTQAHRISKDMIQTRQAVENLLAQ